MNHNNHGQPTDNIDPLTGLLSKKKFDELLERELHRFERYQRPFSLVIMNIDHFSSIEQQQGNETAERILKETAEIVRQNSRIVDIVCHTANDEFLIALPENNMDGGYLMAEDLRNLIESHDFGEAIPITASFGVDMIREVDSLEEMFARTYKALKNAKDNGCNQVETVIDY